jgi:hypothetical protein
VCDIVNKVVLGCADEYIQVCDTARTMSVCVCKYGHVSVCYS